MTIAVKLLLTVALIFSIAVPFGAFAAGEKTKGRYKTALAANTVMFFGTMLFAVCVLFGGTAFAAESTAAAGLYRRRRCRFRGSIRSTWRYQ